MARDSVPLPPKGLIIHLQTSRKVKGNPIISVLQTWNLCTEWHTDGHIWSCPEILCRGGNWAENPHVSLWYKPLFAVQPLSSNALLGNCFPLKLTCQILSIKIKSIPLQLLQLLFMLGYFLVPSKPLQFFLATLEMHLNHVPDPGSDLCRRPRIAVSF